MSRLRIYADNAHDSALADIRDHDAISAELGKVGIRFEAWEAAQPIAPGASQEEVIAAWREIVGDFVVGSWQEHDAAGGDGPPPTDVAGPVLPGGGPGGTSGQVQSP